MTTKQTAQPASWTDSEYAGFAQRSHELCTVLDTFVIDEGRTPTIADAVKEARYVLACYHEEGHTLNDDRKGVHGSEQQQDAAREIEHLETFIRRYRNAAAVMDIAQQLQGASLPDYLAALQADLSPFEQPTKGRAEDLRYIDYLTVALKLEGIHEVAAGAGYRIPFTGELEADRAALRATLAAGEDTKAVSAARAAAYMREWMDLTAVKKQPDKGDRWHHFTAKDAAGERAAYRVPSAVVGGSVTIQRLDGDAWQHIDGFEL